MGFQFAGFFAQAGPDVLEAALLTWPRCRGRLITELFRGLGVAVPSHALTYGGVGDYDDEQEQVQELAWALENELVGWSQAFPDTTFVFLRAACFGGNCLYEGYICQNGVVLERANDLDENDRSKRIALPRLVRALGVELGGSAHFSPLTRTFFDLPQ
jgi:hypothetical protein